MSTDQLIKCERHPEEIASLTCGGCQKRICTICMTLTGEGPRCPDCMARLNGAAAPPPAPTFVGEVIPAGEEAARADAAKVAYYATEPPKVFCARHPETETMLRCGRCNTPICPRCMVHGAVGIRCPDCAANPQRTVGPKVEQEVAAARGKAPPRDTGFRNYWYKNRAYQKVLPQHYLLAILAGFGTALALGILWGFALEGDIRRLAGRVSGANFSESIMLRPVDNGTTVWATLIDRSIHATIHLLPELFLGVLVAEAISRAAQGRVGPGLQLIAGLGVLLGIFASTVTIGARIFLSATGNFPSLDQLFTQSLSGIAQQFSGNGIGILIFWAIGLAFAVIRLKR